MYSKVIITNKIVSNTCSLLREILNVFTTKKVNGDYVMGCRW